MTLKVSTAKKLYKLQRVFPSDSWAFLFFSGSLTLQHTLRLCIGGWIICSKYAI